MFRALPGVNLLGLLLLVFAGWVVIFYKTIWSAVLIWERSETFAHCFLILPICIYLIHRSWPSLKSLEVRPNYWIFLPLLAMTLLYLLGSLAHISVVAQGAAFILLPLSLWMVLGNSLAKALWFPFCFWLFSIPAGEFLIPSLQNITADISVAMLQLTNIPVYREGLYIAIPGGLFEVAVACSGVRYLIASFSLGVLYAYLTYSQWKKRIVFALFALLLPILANGIRAYGIIIIAYLSDMKLATGVDHLIYGWLFFGIMILLMFSIGGIWADPVEKQPESQEKAVSVPTSTWLPVWALVVLTGLATQFYQSSAATPRIIASVDLSAAFELEQNDLSGQGWLPQFQNPSQEIIGSRDELSIYAAYYEQNQQDAELINSRNKVFNHKGWSKLSEQVFERFTVLEISSASGNRRLLAYAYANDWMTSPSGWKIKAVQALQALLGQPQPGLFVAMSIPVSQASDYRQAFVSEAQAFFSKDMEAMLGGN
ncbi:exosortase A [Aliiglaciecola sp. CAU 1673]|uniref:exosortase A n=1 Tax=Aliiglaciecola sp. CAU 1673 TaxID=3032595 RepID=UPI0023DCBE8E|nr:exosortase A [Aliiglaciecola sp. CAU 1673]MDF2177286.1 exosortase A [Aliiglaciecola sp. CAU 1673]